jgi:hypothetical protein
VSNGAAALVSLQRSRPHLVVANPATRGLRIKELAKALSQSDDGIPLVLAGYEFPRLFRYVMQPWRRAPSITLSCGRIRTLD